MAKETYIEQIFPIECKGRDIARNEVLEVPVDVKVKIYQSPGVTKSFSSMVECPFIRGGHGQRCGASHPNQDKLWEDPVDGVYCPYAFSIPYAFEWDKEE